jgi:UDP-N-acetylmuramoyl-tripeptide--D-alanyl-D-alanine ligase
MFLFDLNNLFYFSYILVSIKQSFIWLYLWQKKGYRWDKMRDYLSLLESKKVILDKWTIFRLIHLIFSLINLFFFQKLTFWLNIIFILASTLEIIFFILKIHKKLINLPYFSNKAILILTLNCSFLFFFGALIFSKFSVLETLFLNLLIIFIPISIILWVIFLFPIDFYLKESVYKKAKIARQKLPHLQAIAVSGAYGKSTIKEVLSFLLSQKFVTKKTFKNQNANYSCANKIINLKPETQFFVCELGSYNRGDGKKICEFLEPTISIISGLNNQHLSLFGSQENIILAESESLDFLPKNSLVAINWNSLMCHKIQIPQQKNLRIIKYGVISKKNPENWKFDIYAKNLEINLDFTKFDLVYQNQTHKLKTNLVSEGNIQNLVGVLALVLNLGFKIDEIKDKLLELPASEGSVNIINKTWGKIVDDSYNANFDGIKNVLELLFEAKKTSQKPVQNIILLDDIMELGVESIPTHQKLAKIIVENNIDWVFLLGRNFAWNIYEELLKNGFDKDKIIFREEKNPTKITIKLNQIIDGNPDVQKIVLFEGFQSRKYIKK